jgi:hypothetical protein
MSATDEMIEEIINSIIKHYNITKEQLFGKTRKANIVEARHVFMYILREKFKLSFPAIGRIINRDHTSIMHACDRISKIKQSNIRARSIVEKMLSDDTKYQEDLFSINELSPSVDFKKYIISKHKIEDEEYLSKIKELKEKREFLIYKANEDYKNDLISVKENKKYLDEEFDKTIKLVRANKLDEAKDYLSPKKELLDRFNFKNDISKFFPDYNKKVEELTFPINFNKSYIIKNLEQLDERSKRDILERYGFVTNNFLTLDEIATKENLTRERIRQIISSGIDKLFRENIGGTRQIVIYCAEKIINEDIVDVKLFLSKIFTTANTEQENLMIGYFLFIMSCVKWVKEFILSNKIFFINSSNENYVFKQIDYIKDLIEKIDKAMPDLIDDKWEYIFNNLQLYEYFLDKKHLLNEEFLRACYDNYLFESEIVIYKNNTSKKFNTIEERNNGSQTNGVPREYNVFFN